MRIAIFAVPTRESGTLESPMGCLHLQHRLVRCYYVELCDVADGMEGISIKFAKTLASAIVNERLYNTVIIINNADSAYVEGDKTLIDYSHYRYICDIGYKEGMNDATANVVREVTERLLGQYDLTAASVKVQVNSRYMLNEQPNFANPSTFGPEGRQGAIGRWLHALHNPLVQYLHPQPPTIKHYRQWIQWDSAQELYNLTKAEGMNLSWEDVEAICNYVKFRCGTRYSGEMMLMNRLELEALAQTWSEHCKHRIFNATLDEIQEGIFKHYIKGATESILREKPNFCVSVFSDNAGAIVFDDDYAITHKVETHNSPSALDPCGGAMTGILGVNRDCLGFGLGAKPIANTYAFCFPYANNVELYRDQQCQHPLLSAEQIINGVVKGIEIGGNCSGIPTVQGLMTFDPCYLGKPLVYAGTVGIIPRKIGERLTHQKSAQNGDYIVILGEGAGRDGIHGATLSSSGGDERSDINMVQCGDPYAQKKVCDAVLEMRDLGLFTAITDNGAGGLSSSVGEMGHSGFVVNINAVRIKQAGLLPWEIWISESQERMTLAVPRKQLDTLLKVAHDHGVSSCVIGQFNDSGRAKVLLGKNTDYQHEEFLEGHAIMDLDLDFLHNGYHKMTLRSEKPGVLLQYQHNFTWQDYHTISWFAGILSLSGVCTRAKLAHRFDHEVQGNSVVKPIINEVSTDAAVIRPVFTSNKGVVISSTLSPIYWFPIGQEQAFDYDTYDMVACAIDSTIAKLVATGADPDHIALLDNFCWRASLDQRSLWQLRRAAEACYDLAVAYGSPFISGKDSMFNEMDAYKSGAEQVKLAIKPTVLISGVSVMRDIRDSVTMDFKNSGDLIYIIGKTHDEIGGCSAFARWEAVQFTTSTNYDLGEPEEVAEPESIRSHSHLDCMVPKVNPKEALANYRNFHALVREGCIESAIALNIGGLFVGLAKSAMSSDLGFIVNLDTMPYDNWYGHRCDETLGKLFSETASRILVTIKAKNKSRFEDIMGHAAVKIGNVTRDQAIFVARACAQPMEFSLDDLRNCYADDRTTRVV